MTRIGYVKPQAFKFALEALTQPPSIGLRFCPLSSYRFRSTARYCTCLHRLGTGTFLGFAPFSAITVRRARWASTPTASRPQVFTTSRQELRPQQIAGLFHPAGTRRVEPSEIISWLIGNHLWPRAPSSLSALHGFLPNGVCSSRLRAAGLYAFGDVTPSGPSAVYETAGSHLGLGPTLKLYSQPGLPLSSEGFTPPTRVRLSWLFLLQGCTHRWPWAEALPLLRFEPP